MSSSVEVNLEPTLGSLLIGLVLGSVFLGITLLQTAFYYRTYSKDTLLLKLLVGGLCVLDILSLVLWSHATYTYVIIGFGNLEIADTVVWSDAAEPPVTGVIALAVHLFLAWRIQILDRRWRWFSFVLVVASFASLVSPIAATVIEAIGIQNKTPIDTVNKNAQWCTIVGDVFSAVVDVSIALSLTYLIHRGRSAFSKTNRLRNALTLYIVTSGLITAIIRLLELTLYFAYPTALYFVIPYISTSKAYTNALLATLNSRIGRRGGFSTAGTMIEWRVETGETSEAVDMTHPTGQLSSEGTADLKAYDSGVTTIDVRLS